MPLVDLATIAEAVGVEYRTVAEKWATSPAWPPHHDRAGLGGAKRWLVEDLPKSFVRRGKTIDVRDRVITHLVLRSARQGSATAHGVESAEFHRRSSSAAITAALPPVAAPAAGGFFIPAPAAPDAAGQKTRRRGRAYSAEALWAWFASRPAAIQDEGRRRAGICAQVRALIDAGMRARRAIAEVARASGTAEGTVRRWWYGDGAILGAAHVAAADYAPALAPRYVGCDDWAEMSPEAWEWVQADWLRPEQPALRSCYRRLLRIAAQQGWQVPSYATVQRRIAELPWQIVVLAREGEEALQRRLPHVTRLRGSLHALEAVCADGHTFDLRVELPSGGIGRPVLVAWQDIYSGKILSWRVGETLNQHLVRLAFGETIERYGVPDHAFLDNGREFANKWMTGGAPTRFRFRIREDDPIGIFGLLGVTVHWTTPYHGQAKPIERAFRDLCEEIAKHPAAAGAYTGNSPVTKPDNYGSRALKWDEFVALVDEAIREHNARTGRRTETARGRSFDETFAESYQRSVIRRPTAEQRRLWLMAAEGVTVRDTGHVAILGNLYWSEQVAAHVGRKVVVRFDPDRLDQPVHCYTLDGAYLGEAACTQAHFLDADAAREHARANRSRIRAARAQLEAERKMRAIEASQMLPAGDHPDTPQPAAVQVMPAPKRRARRIDAEDAVSPHVTQQERAVLTALDQWASEKRIVGGDF
jgi:transposase InsO family protein